MKKIPLSKIIFAAAIIIALIFLAVIYKSQKESNSEVEEYKKIIFESLECQYSCQGTTINSSSDTRVVPDPTCLSNCVATAKMRAPQINISQSNLTDDALLKEIDTARTQCFSQNQDSQGNINQTTAFACAYQKLQEIKKNYSYLN